MKYLHIGLPKTGSTFLQKKIFLQIEKKGGIQFINIYNLIDKSRIIFHPLENFRNFQSILPKKFIISNENLFSYNWEFKNIKKSFEIIKKNFSKDVVILIAINDPYEILNSIFNQKVKEYKKIKIEKFFIKSKKNKLQKKIFSYNVIDFNFDNLIKLYKSYFEKVIIFKKNQINNPKLYKIIFDINGINLDNKKNYNFNKSISSFGIHTILFLNKYFNLRKYEKKILDRIKNNKKFSILNKFLKVFLIRDLFQYKIDPVLKLKKYYYKRKLIPLNLKKLKKNYEEHPDIKIY